MESLFSGLSGVDTELWAALGGAFVGGIIGLVGQWLTINATRKQRAEDRDLIQKATGRSLLFKIIRINSNLYGYHNHVEDCYAKVDESLHEEPHAFLLPVLNHADPVHFTESEMAFAMSFNDDDVFNKLLSLDVVHNSTITLMKEYALQREALTELMPVHAMEGQVATTVLNSQEVLKLMPRMVAVNMAAIQARERLQNDYNESKQVLRDVHKILREKYGFRNKIEFKDQAA